jgi:hypothetical protein|tara:strand:+ start:319 stop:501 length:183 start_codon:yes stop_codon:yes gene_type:complete
MRLTEKEVSETHEEVLKTPLGDFLKEAADLGYTFFFKDIIKKVIVARLQQKGLLDDNNNT